MTMNINVDTLNIGERMHTKRNRFNRKILFSRLYHIPQKKNNFQTTIIHVRVCNSHTILYRRVKIHRGLSAQIERPAFCALSLDQYCVFGSVPSSSCCICVFCSACLLVLLDKNSNQLNVVVVSIFC